MPRNLLIRLISVLLKEKNFFASLYEGVDSPFVACKDGGGGGGGSFGRAGTVIRSLKDWDTPTLPSFVDPAEKDCMASLREGRDIILSLVVSWNMIPPFLSSSHLPPEPGFDLLFSKFWTLDSPASGNPATKHIKYTDKLLVKTSNRKYYLIEASIIKHMICHSGILH